MGLIKESSSNKHHKWIEIFTDKEKTFSLDKQCGFKKNIITCAFFSLKRKKTLITLNKIKVYQNLLQQNKYEQQNYSRLIILSVKKKHFF